MTEPENKRRLAAIMVADIVGYSGMMAEDEEGTLEGAKALFAEVIMPGLKAHDGHAFKEVGDAVLADFDSTVKALDCAMAIQKTVNDRNRDLPADRQMRLRIGLFHDDVIFRDGEVFGHGVNSAARLQPLAPVGGVCMSEQFWDSVKNATKAEAVDFGEHAFKNLGKPMRVFAVKLAWEPEPKPPPPSLAIDREPPRRLPGWDTDRADQPTDIARLSAELRGSNEPDTAFVVHAVPTFGVYRDEHEGIGLEIGVKSAVLSIASPSHDVVPYSMLGERESHPHITPEAAGLRINGPLTNGMLRGNAVAQDDGYVAAMRAITAPAEGASAEVEQVTLRLRAARPDFVVRPLRAGNAAALGPKRQAVLDALIFARLPHGGEDDLRHVLLAFVTSRRSEPRKA